MLSTSTCLLVSTRPIQDDYFMLSSLSNGDMRDLLSFAWSNFGGNIASLLIRAPGMFLILSGHIWLGAAVFTFTTLVICYSAIVLLTTWMLNIKNESHGLYLHFLAILTLLGFEGFFSPGLVNAFQFSGASAVHLWPYCLFILAIAFLRIPRVGVVISLSMLFIAANSGLVEGIAILIILSLLLLEQSRIGRCNYLLDSENYVLRWYLLTPVILGNLFSFLAPGLWIRSGVDNDGHMGAQALFHNFVTSISAFGLDFLTHPALLLAFALGSKFGKSISDLVEQYLVRRVYFLSGCTLLILSLNIAGSTVGYAAWHQSVGTFFFASPAFFGLGIITRNTKLNILARKTITTVLAIVVFLIVVRGNILAFTRGIQWDQAYKSNICNILSNDELDLIGAENIYPPFQLGVTDIESWSWMRDDYLEWIKASHFKKNRLCD